MKRAPRKGVGPLLERVTTMDALRFLGEMLKTVHKNRNRDDGEDTHPSQPEGKGLVKETMYIRTISLRLSLSSSLSEGSDGLIYYGNLTPVQIVYQESVFRLNEEGGGGAEPPFILRCSPCKYSAERGRDTVRFSDEGRGAESLLWKTWIANIGMTGGTLPPQMNHKGGNAKMDRTKHQRTATATASPFPSLLFL